MGELSRRSLEEIGVGLAALQHTTLRMRTWKDADPELRRSLCVAVTWTRSSTRKQCATTKKFTRQKKHQVSIKAAPPSFRTIWLILCLSLASLDHKQLLKRAQLELKKSKRKDYYKVLGVGKNATDDEIKKAYRKRALLHHPGSALRLLVRGCF